MDFKEITDQSRQAVTEILEKANLTPGSIFVVGCSSSEILGDQIGTATNLDSANAVFDGIVPVLEENGIFMAAQCCEHLNRALVVERETMEKYGFEQVNAIPQPNHAGGAFATVCYQRFKNPVLVESINARADAGIDIGGTMIGMHLHSVVVPMRISLRKIGAAPIICARHRPKYVGGQRAIYDESLM
ncbi:MAG: TIGR01440 family protein [Butyrivibrio sp.]|uniref:TIGR01440 family protein n=1 Tax=Butyrivibrio sp. LB2008 TaxID=1408305 RepID=UPI00047BD96D|nr:TIGR01440 family protein [Butyrivibrio sp. LB2008]MEE3495164.1 TIGR01440 family protein [Butyrivibrio sp.]